MISSFPSSSIKIKDAILFESIEGLKNNTFLDNFDARRFNFDGVDRSEKFGVEQRLFWFSWLYENYEKLFQTFELLKSDRSKRLFINLLAYRLGGHLSIRIDTPFNEKSAAFEQYQAIEKHKPSSLPDTGMFGSLKHFDFTYKNKHYLVDCISLRNYLYRRQYFFDNGVVRIEPSEADYVIDAGACLGDTAIVFGKAVGKKGKIFAFDPVKNHLDVLAHNVDQNPDCNIQVMPFGLGDADVLCSPIKLQTYSPGFSLLDQAVPVRSLDSLVIDGTIPRVGFIKMDIEGAELSAIKGAAGSIRKFRPKLAISLYHKPNDIYEIPIYISKEFPFYEFYIEHYTIHMEETVLYCNPV